MAEGMQHESESPKLRRSLKVVGIFKGSPAVFLGLVLVIWVVLPLIPEETGLKFGLGYRLFFTAMVVLSAAIFWLIGRDRVPLPQSTLGAACGLVAVFLLTVGLLVTAGVVYPQFDLPEPPEDVSQDATTRGEGLFFSGSVGCFRCHTVSGKGGTRGPDLTNVASRAGERVPGLTDEQYLLEKVKAGGAYGFTVPEYVPMMPEFGKLLTEEQLEDLVTYLKSLK